MELYEKCRVTEILKKQGTIFISFSREILFNLDIPLSNGKAVSIRDALDSELKYLSHCDMILRTAHSHDWDMILEWF